MTAILNKLRACMVINKLHENLSRSCLLKQCFPNLFAIVYQINLKAIFDFVVFILTAHCDAKDS